METQRLKKNKVFPGFCRNLTYNIYNMPATPLASGNAKHWRAFFFRGGVIS